MKRRHKHSRKFFIISLPLCVILGILYAMYNGLTVKTYIIKTDKLPQGTEIRIVQLSDLHSTIYGKNQQTLIDRIKRQNPDLILLTGDIADDEVPIDGTRLLLSGIVDTAPLYYVTGNHEYLSWDIENILEELRAFGVNILSDRWERLAVNGNSIIIAGVEDPVKINYGTPDYDWQASMREAFGELEEDGEYKILLAHRPENIDEYTKYPFDLVLSGHAHGGQVRVPFFLNGLYAPNQGWFPEYAGGLYERGGLRLIVSRGLSISPRLPRVFNPPEIVVVVLSGV